MIAGMLFFVVSPIAFAQYSTPPLTEAEWETIYTKAIEKRTDAILDLLVLEDAAKSNRVHDVIVAQYRSLRARDAAMDTMFEELAKNAPGAETNRAAVLPILSAPLHARFISKLSEDLSPEQLEQVKDKMTYNKVKVTYDAYLAIVPNLNESEKAMILETLKQAREEAMDGGSADEKSAIFQKYKDRINARLAANGHDVEKATKEWEARQTASAQPEGTTN